MWPSYDEEAGILSLTSSCTGEWSLGFHIDGLVVVDGDTNGTVRNLDVLAPRSSWARTPTKITADPDASRLSVLEIERSIWERKILVLDVDVETDGSIVRVRLGDATQHDSLVALSPHSSAGLADGRLVALYADLRHFRWARQA